MVNKKMKKVTYKLVYEQEDSENIDNDDSKEYVDAYAEYIKNALSPAKDAIVTITDPMKKEALAIVNDDNLSLAIGKKGTNIKNIKKVISHPQALSQCNSYILEKGFEKVESSNTAIAAYELSQSDDDSVAVIASKEVANLYDLEVLQANINESRNNTTRFAVFSKVLNKRKVVNKMGEHFILVFTVLNEAGALAKTLNIIGAHNFNMRTLRSRPMKELLWNYYFFVEADGDINSSDGQDMIKELSSVCDRLKVVGTYYSYIEK